MNKQVAKYSVFNSFAYCKTNFLTLFLDTFILLAVCVSFPFVSEYVVINLFFNSFSFFPFGFTIYSRFQFCNVCTGIVLSFEIFSSDTPFLIWYNTVTFIPVGYFTAF